MCPVEILLYGRKNRRLALSQLILIHRYFSHRGYCFIAASRYRIHHTSLIYCTLKAIKLLVATSLFWKQLTLGFQMGMLLGKNALRAVLFRMASIRHLQLLTVRKWYS
jgi:hypothetical protein